MGRGANRTVSLDDDVAGWGWFVDPTAWEDSEFTTPGNQGEWNRMDLLTVLEHELGHLLGLEHTGSGVMTETLVAGTRRIPSSDYDLVDLAILDKVFADGWTSHADPFTDGSVFEALVGLQKQRKGGRRAKGDADRFKNQ